MSDTNLISHRQTPGHQTAIVFIHGFGGLPEKTWAKFPDLLLAEAKLSNWDILSLGYPTGLLPDIVGIWKAQPNIETVARVLTTITSLKFERYQSIAWVAHSMGGLVLQRALIDDESFLSKAGHVFLFGTPSNGLIKASFFKFWKRQIDNMTRNGEFIVDLRKRWIQKFVDRPASFELFVTAGDQDEFVPGHSSLGPFLSLIPRNCFVIPGDHLSIVKPITSEHLGFQLVLNRLTRDAATIVQADAARMAVEMRQFHQVINSLEANKNDLDDPGLVKLALAYEGVGRQEDAVKLLETVKGDTDALGVLAGRLKRRWLVEQKREDGMRARELYRERFRMSVEDNDPSQAFYHGINLAFMTLAYSDKPEKERLAAARDIAQQVLMYCEKAPMDKWRQATEAEAKYILGKREEALKDYQAVTYFKPALTPRELDSTYQQALRLASILGDQQTAERLSGIFGRAT
jgi:pimeloyl-ACP methyl ester carboxylesterase